MKTIIQTLGAGVPKLVDAPCPALSSNSVLIRSRVSLISAGTERMLVEFGKSNWLAKARKHPEQVRLALAKARTDGIAATVSSVRAKLESPISLGYSNAGVVIDASGTAVRGTRVVSNGPHAELVSVPQTLCAPIPDGVPDDWAAFAVVGAVGLQGIRLARPELGENVVVMGLGLIGLITVQLLRAQGCRVLALDFSPSRLRLAEQFGAEVLDLSSGLDPLAAAERFSGGRGADAVLITAATSSNTPVQHAAAMCRKRGRIVLVGVAGLQLSRSDFYKKELTFQVSCSYGPGRYDAAYESGGDYPYAYVRWTAQRNIESILEMLDGGRLQVEPLITHRFPFERAQEAYELIQGSEPHLGVLLEYRDESTSSTAVLTTRNVALRPASSSPGPARIGCIGAGNYAANVLLPALRSAGADLDLIVASGGVSAAVAGRKFGFRAAGSSVDEVFSNPAIDTVVVATRHDSHADLVCRALRAGKNVFVEKPLALTAGEVDAVERAYRAAWESGSTPRLMIGFNRRFAPQVVKMRQLLGGTAAPKSMILTVNAGQIDSEHWIFNRSVGGGRLIGEACHFVDLLRFLAGAPVTSWKKSHSAEADESFSITLSFQDGSFGTVHYLTSGHRSFPKERLEVFCGSRILQLDNFRTLKGFGWPQFRRMSFWRQRKGAEETAVAFLDAIRKGSPSPIPFDEILEVSRLTISLAAE